MSHDATLSSLRRALCSKSDASRITACMRLEGISTEIVATDEPLQPWRIVEVTAAHVERSRACG